MKEQTGFFPGKTGPVADLRKILIIPNSE